MQKSGQLQKPVRAGALRKDRRCAECKDCPGCGSPRGAPHQPGCTWTLAAAQLHQPKGDDGPRR